MTSNLHEGLVEFFRRQPQFAAELLERLPDVAVPDFVEVRLVDSTLNDVVPTEFRADAVVVFENPEPVFGVVIEAQLEPDERKRFTWPVYVTTARARHKCPFVLIVVTPHAHTERWSGKPIAIGGDLVHCPYVVGPSGIPKITDPAQAARSPQLAVLSVLAHGKDDVDVAVQITVAAAAAIEQIPPDQQQLYSGLIESALSNAAREAIAMLPQVQKWFSESQRKAFIEGEAKGKAEGEAKGKAEGEAKGKAEGEAKGKAEGRAQALLMVLDQRRLLMSAAQRHQIAECTDMAKLQRWVEQALTVSSVEELLA
jgi:hypothetical protein